MRQLVLAVLMTVGTISVAMRAQAPGAAGAQSDMVVLVEKLKDNLFVLKGGGGNTAVFLTTDGVVVVDTKNPGWGQPILDAIKKITDKPVRTIINTHTHGDHVSGNVAFPATVDVVTHVNTKVNMEAMRTYTGQTQPPRDVFKENKGKGLPTKIFQSTLSLGEGADQIDVYYFGRGHTNGDAWVVFRALRTVHAGDMFLGKRIPFLDANNGGSGVEFPDTVQKAYDTIKNVDTVITGHDTQMQWSDVREWAEFNRSFLNEVRAARDAGKSIDDVADSWKVPARFVGYTAPQRTPLRNNVEVIYNELSRAK
jgi:cyclase